jgi:cytoskeletal protein RodZ
LAKNEEGEFELVLGNRQLISVFLIVVILLAVFFSMGYIVGRNSAPGTATETARNLGSTAPDSQKTSPVPSSPPALQETPAPAADDSTTATHAEQPAPAEAKPAPAPPAPARATKQPKPEPAAERVPAAGEPAPGVYWQVVATARPDADIIAEALSKKGFHALVSPAPREGVYRVLVGPLKDAPTQAQTRTNLEAAGFKNPLMRKY